MYPNRGGEALANARGQTLPRESTEQTHVKWTRVHEGRRKAGQTVMSTMPIIKYIYQWCIETHSYIHIEQRGEETQIKQIKIRNKYCWQFITYSTIYI